MQEKTTFMKKERFEQHPQNYDDESATNPQYIFHVLDWIKRNAVASSVHFAKENDFKVK